MNFGEPVRYKGMLIATGVLLLLVFISAFVNQILYQKSLQSFLTLQKIESLSALYKSTNSLPSSGELAAWEERLTPEQRLWLEHTSGAQLSSVRDAVVESNAGRFAIAMASLKRNVADRAAKQDGVFTMAGVVSFLFLLLFCLLAIILPLVRLSRSVDLQVKSKQQAENLLNNVSEGLFLLNKSGEIGSKQSKSLKAMFHMKQDLEGYFLDFIGQYVSQTTVAITRDYLDLLYGDRVKENLVKDLNPLSRVELSIAGQDGSIETRFLDFNFARVVVEGELQHLLGSVTDVSREVRMEQKLEQNKQDQEAQLDLLMNILRLDRDSFRRFYKDTEESLESINETLQEPGHSSDQICGKLINIAEQAHKIKGDAAALKLYSLESMMHEFESEIAKVQESKGIVTGRDVLPAVTKLKSVFKELNNLQSIVTAFSEILRRELVKARASNTDEVIPAKQEVSSSETLSVYKPKQNNDLVDEVDTTKEDENSDVDDLNVVSKNVSRSRSETVVMESVVQPKCADDTLPGVEKVTLSPSLERELQDLVKTVAERSRVQVTLQSRGLNSVPEHLSKVIRTAAIQFSRNSIVHGARSAQHRAANGKPEHMTIKLVVRADPDGCTMIIRDDGEGLKRDKIVQKAIKKGLVPAAAADKVTSAMLAKIIFHPGFSTRDKVDLDAGRGDGLNAVHTMVKEADGVLGFSHQEGQHCQFSVRFKR